MSRPVFAFVEQLMRDLSDRVSIPSPTAGQLARLRDGTMECVSGNPFRHEEKSHMTALRLLIWNSVAPLAQQALVIRNAPERWHYTFREVSEDELVADPDYDPPVYTTRHGEDLAVEEEQRNPPAPGKRIVRTARPVHPNNHRIAEKLGITERYLRVVLGEAYSTIEGHHLFPIVMGYQ